MTVKEYYEKVHGNYEEALERFMDEARIKKFLLKLPNSTCYDELCKAMQEQNYEGAFKAVHSMKGITANMALSSVYDLTVQLTEELRGGSCSEEAIVLYDQLKNEYDQVLMLLQQI